MLVLPSAAQNLEVNGGLLIILLELHQQLIHTDERSSRGESPGLNARRVYAPIAALCGQLHALNTFLMARYAF